MAKNERFIVTDESNNKMIWATSVITDTETGIQYLFVSSGGYAGGLTPLLNRDGTPKIASIQKRD